jgi:ABC-2 type transport system permease protein
VAPAWSIVARREYAEGVRSRWFVVVTLLGPVLFGGLIVFSILLQLRGSGKPVRVALVDESVPSIGSVVADALTAVHPGGASRFTVERVTPPASDRAALDARVARAEIDGYLVLPRDVVTTGRAAYVGTDASSQVDMARLQSRLETAVVDARARALGLEPTQTQALLAHVDLDTRQANGKGASGDAAFFAAYGAAITLYMTILLYGVAVMRSVIQEKTSRVLEIVVSCASPWDLMVGKVLGVGAVGLTQLGCWFAGGAAIVAARVPLAASVGMAGAASVPLPSIGPGDLAVVVVYFLGGYVLYSTVFAAVGAANNNERDAQQAQMPITFLLVGAFLCFPAITSAPRDAAAVALTMVPFFSPVLMPMRCMLTPVPAWQLGASLAILAATIAGTTWAASRIYRVGILMYGKKPGLGELLRWIGQSGG